ncbi:gallidermin/nisin family lantibiotic [Thermosporothrix hazakensis]|jgi:gallidermin/nisin family lantibiotic|uniref:Gallidermin/nisin family lantibiotic n=1 Tax=Thermosporothrix hazakensis TaxID=644383 RepID=A0A326U2B0_THEHA|nr:gallidermin/nisin family lantibiotic [Thermosporothrix hazakensis]PZW19353.1 gallidermin/nisin family lantibiotic [Thermosporothrix hazakensis]GCE49894.1 hypothetical protein KTH_47630 [Thermosporothrix hazakensis]
MPQHEDFKLEIKVVKYEQEDANATPQITSFFNCTPGCLTNNTCQTCTCAQGCPSDTNTACTY